MTKPAKNKTKTRVSLRIDPNLYEELKKICYRESIATKKRITVSSKMEQLFMEWVNKE
jgi:hypothetical protein